MKLTEKFRVESRDQAQRKSFIELAHEDIALLKGLFPFAAAAQGLHELGVRLGAMIGKAAA